MKAIITGAAGFIGCHMAYRLLSDKWHVVGIDNLSRRGSTINLDWLQNIESDAWHFEYGDIRCADDMDRIFRIHTDTDLVLHSAAQVAVTTSVGHPRHDFEVNALGTLNVLEAVRHYCPQAFFIFPSSNKVYGGMQSAGIVEANGRYRYADRPCGVNEDWTLDFHSPYGCSKGAADQYVRDYARIYGLRTVVCRQSCIYGTRQFGVEDQGWIAWFIIASIGGLPMTIYGDGKQVRDVLWIDDLVDLYMIMHKAADRIAGGVYNVGGGPRNTLSLTELVDTIRRLTGVAIQPERADWRPGDQRVYVSDISKAAMDLAWEPKIGVHQGVATLVEWVRNNLDHIRKALKL